MFSNKYKYIIGSKFLQRLLKFIYRDSQRCDNQEYTESKSEVNLNNIADFENSYALNFFYFLTSDF